MRLFDIIIIFMAFCTLIVIHTIKKAVKVETKTDLEQYTYIFNKMNVYYTTFKNDDGSTNITAVFDEENCSEFFFDKNGKFTNWS